MNPTAHQPLLRIIAIILVLIPTVMVPRTAFSQTKTDDPLSVLAGRIAEKRARVEALSSQVEDTKIKYNEDLRSLETQITDVEIQINREQLRLNQIERDIQAARNEIQASRTSFEKAKPMAARLLLQLHSYVENGFPFQKEERLKAVEQMQNLLDENSVEPEVILTRAWNMVESEFRLASEAGIYRQIVTLAGEDQLAEVAKVGSVFLYFKTFDENYGYTVFTGNDWEYCLAADREERQQIAALFDALRRNLQQGFFTLPNPNTAGGAS